MSAGADTNQDASLSQTIRCKDVTGLECDFVSKSDESAEWAERGLVTDQLLTNITTHIGKEHPERVLSEEEIDKLRARIT